MRNKIFPRNANNPKTLFATVNAVINPIQNMHPDPAVISSNRKLALPNTIHWLLLTVWSDFQLTTLPALKDIVENDVMPPLFK